MKITLKIEIDFESWFEDNREPKTNEEWTDFFSSTLTPEGQMLGLREGEYDDMIALSSFYIECTNICK
jgi:hypothetical protein